MYDLLDVAMYRFDAVQQKFKIFLFPIVKERKKEAHLLQADILPLYAFMHSSTL